MVEMVGTARLAVVGAFRAVVVKKMALTAPRHAMAAKGGKAEVARRVVVVLAERPLGLRSSAKNPRPPEQTL